MIDFFNFGEDFLFALSEIGDWLLYKPFGWVSYAVKWTSIIGDLVLPEDVFNWLIDFSSISLGKIIFSGALTGILAYKLIKWVLDIVF